MAFSHTASMAAKRRLQYPQTAVRFTPEDEAILAALQKRTGMVNRSDLIRLALRALAKEHGVKH
jgi:Ribbon-helix-helix protein, copG family